MVVSGSTGSVSGKVRDALHGVSNAKEEIPSPRGFVRRFATSIFYISIYSREK